MTSRLPWITVAIMLVLSLPARAIILDCKKNPDGTYLCVEIGNPTEPAAASPAQTDAAKLDRAYVERAKKHCTYQEPRRRGTGMGAGGAQKSEAVKLARDKYERCLASKARELKNADQNR